MSERSERTVQQSTGQAVEVFTEHTRTQAAEIIARYPQSRSALLPMLHLVQSVEGYVSQRGVAFCAEMLGLTKAEVGAVATFYTMYKRRPSGDWLVSVCTNTMCGVLGGDKAYQALSEYLGVGHDETTSDGTITLEHAECLAACDYAPVMTVNYEFFDKVDADTALDVVRKLRDGQRPAPSRGARLCTFKEMSLQLAGWNDERDNAVGEGPASEPTVAGNRLAAAHGISVAGFDPSTPIASPRTSDPVGRTPANRSGKAGGKAGKAAAGTEKPTGEAESAAKGATGKAPASPEKRAGKPRKESGR